MLVPLLNSNFVIELIEIVGSGSLSWIVALAKIVALTGEVTRIWKSSLASSMSSARTSTVIVPVVAPAGMTSVPAGTSAKSATVAPPGVVFQLTVVGNALGFANFTRNEAVAVAVPSGSRTTPAFATDTTIGAASSSTIVPVACPVLMLAFVGFWMPRSSVSSDSSTRSPVIEMSTNFPVSPGANVSEPVTGVKSTPVVAVPGFVPYSSVTTDCDGLESATEKGIVVMPLSPSSVPHELALAAA